MPSHDWQLVEPRPRTAQCESRPAGVSRRQWLAQSACGFGSLALAGLLGPAAHAAPADPLAPKPPHLPARAKRILFLFMQGGPSHVDTFDYKPELTRRDGEEVDLYVARTRQVSRERLFGSPWPFRRHGESGTWVSELFPHVARHADQLCMIKSVHTEGVAHGPATLMIHTGATSLVRPSMGAWVTYGLGTHNDSLPGFVTLSPPPAMGGARNYAAAFLPAVYQGSVIGRAEQPFVHARLPHIANEKWSSLEQQRQLALLGDVNRMQLAGAPASDELDAVIRSFELANRMQDVVPTVMDLGQETAETQQLYGLDDPATADYGRQCLLARRLAEAGVRYIQVNYADNSNGNPRWDQHSNLQRHEIHARAVDKPIAGLLTDLKRRGLLDDTLVWWGGEFGRTPYAQGRDGRDHNPLGFTVWLAGAGTRPGFSYGATDDFGHQAVHERVHMHDLHATLLYLLGLDHERLTYRYAGRDFRLTDVHGRVVREVLL